VKRVSAKSFMPFAGYRGGARVVVAALVSAGVPSPHAVGPAGRVDGRRAADRAPP
jgi:hypothetical protein